MKRIGFVGLGMMGAPMAGNLVQSGFEVVAHDVRLEAVEALAGRGATAARGLSEVAACDAAVVMVNTDPQAREVIHALIAQAKARPFAILSMSTILPSTIRTLGEEAAGADVGVLDAPVSGGPVVAQLGALAIMVGGEAALFEEARPLLEAMGRSVTHVGPLGAGLTTKLVNNMIGVSTVPLVAEALRVAVESGLDLDTVIEVIRASTGNTWITDQWDQARALLGVVVRDPSQLHSLMQTGLKDLELAQALCEETGVAAPFLRSATEATRRLDVGDLRETLDRVLEAAGK